jgi:hemerythrin-like domain-containing protein
VKTAEPVRRGSGDAPTHPGLLGRPLDFISEDHLRERQICAVIDAIALAAQLDRQAALTVLRFLNEELNVHLRDEAETLFPLLAKRCTAEDCIENAINRIRVDQDAALRLLPEVRSTLAGCLDDGSDLTPEGRAMLTRFAGHVRRHLVAENAILLPIARARLTRADLATLAAQMRARRELTQNAEAGHAE